MAAPANRAREHIRESFRERMVFVVGGGGDESSVV
jgi:hypothetical protein